MTILIAGATGATGRLLAKYLLDWGHHVRLIVRSADRLPEDVRTHDRSEIIVGSLLDLSNEDLVNAARGCDAIGSCLGHNLTFKGVYGKPRRLVTDATRRLCEAAISNDPDNKVRFVLMNTSGNRNRDLDEKLSLSHRAVVGLLRLLLPPHTDNEHAADYLRVKIGQNHPVIEWVAVRPDGLIDEDTHGDYTCVPSPVRDPIFDAGKTSRANVAHFMATLATDDQHWSKWQGQMPVIYNSEYVK